MNIDSQSSPSSIAVLTAATLASLALAACGGEPEPFAGVEAHTGALSSKTPPASPDPTLVVPEGNRLAFDLDATGVQIYACAATASGALAWVFQAPEATLFNPGGRTAGIHYAGPTWEANDGSTVVAARVAGFTVDPSAIPWLLLGAVSNTGHGRMAKVSFVQRFATTGGLAPATGCGPDQVGQIARVGYTATYYFYEPKNGNGNGSGNGNGNASCR